MIVLLNMNWTNEDLKLLKKRKSELVERLYNEYKTGVFNFILTKTKGDEDVACDILAETFCSAIDSLDKIKHAKNIQGWLMRIAYFKLNDYLRKEYHQKKYPEYFEVKEIDEADMEQDLYDKQQIAIINMTINNLKPPYGEILRLKYIENKSQKEIAKIMDKTVSSVEGVIVRGRKMLREQLKNNEGFLYEN